MGKRKMTSEAVHYYASGRREGRVTERCRVLAWLSRFEVARGYDPTLVRLRTAIECCSWPVEGGDAVDHDQRVAESARVLVAALDYQAPGWRAEFSDLDGVSDEIDRAWDSLVRDLAARDESEE